MKYSIIIPYRDRKNNLELLLPRLLEFFQKEDFEIIISEQDNNENFRIACVENIGYLHSKGDTVVFHQVDYYPTEDVSYVVENCPILPARKGIFVNDDFTKRNYLDIPGGYRNWENEIDPNFYGGVIAMKRDHFEKINGINPMYSGWGNEDEDLRERFKWAGIEVKRNENGTFYCLYHRDNGDFSDSEDRRKDFWKGRKLLMEGHKYKDVGYKNLKYEVEEFDAGMPNVRWIKSKNYKINLENVEILSYEN